MRRINVVDMGIKTRLVSEGLVLFVLFFSCLTTARGQSSIEASPTIAINPSVVNLSQRDPRKLQLTGTADLYSGSSARHGQIVLVVDDAGAYSLNFKSTDGGIITESATAIGVHRVCSWSKDGIAHSTPSSGCAQPSAWFLPHMLFTESYGSKLSRTDAGVDSTKRRHVTLSTPSTLIPVSQKLKSSLQRWSALDVTIDPGTQLPSELSYSAYPMGSSVVTIKDRVTFDGYFQEQQVWIPKHIQRFANGSREWDIVITSAVVDF